MYRAALQDALAYTTDRDGCGECDRAHLCETHASRAARAEQYQQALEQQMEAGSWATQAVLDAIHSGQLRAELLEDCGFWATKAAQQQMEAEAEIDPGPTKRQLEDWNIHNDHADGLTPGYDLDREA